MTTSISIFPSEFVSDLVVEPYNAVLAMTKLTNFSDIVFPIDNESLYSICANLYKLKTPTYFDLNHIINGTLSNITYPFRFSGMLNSDMRKLHHSMTDGLNPKFRFLSTSFAPFTCRCHALLKPFSIGGITYDLLTP